MIQIANINIPEQNIVMQKIFMADKVVPIAIQRDDEKKNIYKILFSITQGIDNRTIFLETRMQAEDSIDTSYVMNKSIYLPNIIANETSREAYKKIMENFDLDKFYFGDFSFKKTSMTNHVIRAYKDVNVTGPSAKKDQKYYEQMTIHVPRYMYIIFNLYLDNLLEPFSDVEDLESLFVNKDLKGVKFEKIEGVKMVATCKTPKGETDDGTPLFSYNTHYEMNCGPTFFKFNYEIITPEDREVKIPLDSSLFMPEYSNMDKKYIGMVHDQDCYYIVIKDDDGKIKALRIDLEMLEQQTNLLNPYIIFKNYKPTILSQEFKDKNGNPRAVKVGDKILRPINELDLLKMTHGLPIDIKVVNEDKPKNTGTKKKTTGTKKKK